MGPMGTPNAGPANSTTLPLHGMGSPNKTGRQLMLFWLFFTSDLYNWKTQNAKSSDNPRDLMGLLDTVLFTHQATWDVTGSLHHLAGSLYHQREGTNSGGSPEVCPVKEQTANSKPSPINAAFPLFHPTWEHNLAEGKETLRVHRQTLMAGIQAAACKPTNLTKVYGVRQDKDESPAAFVE